MGVVSSPPFPPTARGQPPLASATLPRQSYSRKTNRMSMHVEYREYTISSTPVQLSEKNEWKSAIVISSEREGVVTAQPYTDETTYTTEEAADTHGITLGQQIIDGKALELSEN